MEKTHKIVLFFLLLGFAPISVDAASLSFSQTTPSYSIGQTFSVSVYVGSSDQAMNAASGVISFSWDKLQVVTLSKTGSILSLWAEEPSFSNSLGTVNFEGIVLNPGFIGAQGKIITVTFKAKSVGQANLSFSSGSILANDGTGTNILNNLGVAVVNIDNQTPIPAAEDIPNVTEKNAPAITSLTHPDQTKWYKEKNSEFSWTLPKGALEVRTSISSKPSSVPTVSYIPPISSKKIDALSDGTHYFHLQIRTTLGWGGVAHYRINIDTTPPKPFSITFPHGKNSLEPQPVILFNTIDGESGISHYEVKIGDKESNQPGRTAPDAVSNPYPLPPQDPGAHVVVVTAFDRVGNTTTASSDFTIEAIEAPIITSYPEEIQSGDLVKIRGTAYPDSDIDIIIYQDKKIIHQELARSNNLGDFSSVIIKRLDPGVYNFTVRVTDGRGAKSNETSPLTIVIKSRLSSNVVTFILSYLSVSVLVLLILCGFIGTGIFMWYKFSRLIRRFRRESYEAEKMLGKSFSILRKDIDTHIDRLKKARNQRKLTDEEILFLENFEKNLTEAGDIISEKIKEISHNS